MNRTPMRVGFELLDENLKNLINSSAKIFPVNLSYVQSNTNPNNYEYVRIVDGVQRNNVYIWLSDIKQWSLIGADDKDVYWTDIKDKPTSFPPESHNHDTSYYTKTETDDKIKLKVDKVDGKGLSTNDFDDAYKSKLESLHSDASFDYTEVNERVNAHTTDSTLHVTAFDREQIDSISSKASKVYVDQGLANKVASSTFNGHTSNTTIHITQDDKDYINNNLDKNYIHTQSIPSLTWTIPHNLNKYCDVLIKDNSGEIVIGRVNYVDINNMQISFTHEVSGMAILN